MVRCYHSTVGADTEEYCYCLNVADNFQPLPVVAGHDLRPLDAVCDKERHCCPTVDDDLLAAVAGVAVVVSGVAGGH